MSTITEKHCKDFRENPQINPLSKRAIKMDGPIYKKLMAVCHTSLSTNIKPMYQPPMGPNMHPEIDPGNERENAIAWMKYIHLRIAELNDLDHISEMELEDLKEMIDYLLLKYNNTKAAIVLKMNQDTIRKMERERRLDIVKDARVKKKQVEVLDFELRPSRYFTRTQVVAISRTLKSTLNDFKMMIDKNEVTLLIPKDIVKLRMSYKVYLDALIEHKYFTKKEIYHDVFDDEDIFAELEKAYKKYATMYKKAYGKTP